MSGNYSSFILVPYATGRVTYRLKGNVYFRHSIYTVWILKYALKCREAQPVYNCMKVSAGPKERF